MFIEDDELRDLYQTASTEHIQKLEAGLLALEQEPENLTPLTELLREAHSLKGDSRMLGVKDVEALIHQIEHTLQQVQKGEQVMDGQLSDRLYHGLDAIKQIVNEAVTGQPSGLKTFQVLAQLMGADPSPATEVAQSQNTSETPSAAHSSTSPPTSSETTPPTPSPNAPSRVKAQLVTTQKTQASSLLPDPLPFTPNPSPQTPPPEPSPATTYQIETIRVATAHLDRLITQTGELTVTKVQTAHVANKLAEVLAIWDEWKTKPEAQQALLIEQLDQRLNTLKNISQENTTRLEAITSELEDQVHTLRLLPLGNVFQFMPRLVRDLAKEQGKQVQLVIEGEETTADKRILEEIRDPLIHLIRNAIDHGIEPPEVRQQQGKAPTATLWLTGSKTTHNVIIEVRDDGRGLDTTQIRQKAAERGLYSTEELAQMTPSQIYNLIFLPGLSTRNLITDLSGRGVGLDVVQTNVAKLKGTIQVESMPGQGTQFQLQLGTTLATANVLLVSVGGIPHAIPLEAVETSLLVEPSDRVMIDGTEAIVINGEPISVAHLETLLAFAQPLPHSSNSAVSVALPCVLLHVGEERFGVFVDDLLDIQDVVLKPQSQVLQKVKTVAGATILGTGEVCMILHPPDLLREIQQGRGAMVAKVGTEMIAPSHKPLILLTEDSITIRTQEKRILEGAGYEVVTAVDGLDGWNKLPTRPFDAVISDVQMPNLDGLSLAQRIRERPEYNELPIILVTSLASEDDRRRGAEAGADAYITKGAFNQTVLLETLERLI
ncbi:MAG: hybrid sensor histidine kinase/response regulator [Spirulina sp. SIO3F2]|nr:hybrid sensor histidine kinase/response regulator [Spirulina sp. SIO3F2]